MFRLPVTTTKTRREKAWHFLVPSCLGGETVGRHEQEGRRQASGRKELGRVSTQQSEGIPILIQYCLRGAQQDEESGHVLDRGSLLVPCPPERVGESWGGAHLELLDPPYTIT